MEADEDATLMAEFVRTRDRRVFTRLFERYERPIYAHARRFVADPALAEELVQETFVRVYTTKRYEARHRFRTWLYRVATNVCLNELRRGHHGAPHEEADERPLASPHADPEASLEGKRLAEAVQASLERLPPKQRAAFLMVRHDGMSHDEIAVALDTSVSAVKSLVHRALETLRRDVETARDLEPRLAAAGETR